MKTYAVVTPTTCPQCRYHNGGRFTVCPICKVAEGTQQRAARNADAMTDWLRVQVERGRA